MCVPSILSYSIRFVGSECVADLNFRRAPFRPATCPSSPSFSCSQSIFSDAMGGIAYLGGMVKKLGSQLGDVDAVEETFKKGGAKLKSAFEDAYQFITEDEEIQRHPISGSPPRRTGQGASNAEATPSKDLSTSSAVPSTPSAFPSTPGSAPSNASSSSSGSSATMTASAPASRASLASPTFASLFEAKMGAVDLSALENLSMHASLQLQQILRKLDDAQRVTVAQQQDELRAIFAADSLAEGEAVMDLATVTLPESTTATAEGEEPTRDKFQTQLQALHQKVSFYASRTASLQSFALKALNECNIPDTGDIQALTEGTLNYRGKMQLEALRQLAEFTALSVHQILLAAEHVKEHHQRDPSMDIVAHAKLVHALTLTTKQLAWSISSHIVASMKALGNTFKEKATTIGAAHQSTPATVQATLKRISAGISSVQLDLATAMGSLLDASRFTIAIFQHLQASKLTSTQV